MSQVMDSGRRPPIVLCASDRSLLEHTAMSAMLQSPREAGALLQEVDRATVVDDPELGRDVVRVGSWVEFADDAAGEVRTVRLVAEPGDAASSDEVLALSNLGAALIGLRVGQTIVWPDRVGTVRVLSIVRTGGADG